MYIYVKFTCIHTLILSWTCIYILACFQKGTLSSNRHHFPSFLLDLELVLQSPFHGFVEDWTIQSESSATAPLFLFFGCRNEDSNFLYKGFRFSHSWKRKNVLWLNKKKGRALLITLVFMVCVCHFSWNHEVKTQFQLNCEIVFLEYDFTISNL